MFRVDVVQDCRTSSHLAGLPNQVSFCLSKASFKVACKPRAFAEWSARDPCLGQCKNNPGNLRASDEHVFEAGVCFSVRRIELEWKDVSGS